MFLQYPPAVGELECWVSSCSVNGCCGTSRVDKQRHWSWTMVTTPGTSGGCCLWNSGCRERCSLFSGPEKFFQKGTPAYWPSLGCYHGICPQKRWILAWLMIAKLLRFQFLGTASFSSSPEISQLWELITRKLYINILQGGCPLRCLDIKGLPGPPKAAEEMGRCLPTHLGKGTLSSRCH